jgi:diguanylate cyclase
VAFLSEHPAFIALGEAHEQMHHGAAQLLQRIVDELPVSPEGLDQFNNVLDRMRLEMQSLRHELADTAQNRDPLTGARSRASLLSDLREQHALVRRGVQECALAMITWTSSDDRPGPLLRTSTTPTGMPWATSS